MTTKKSVDWWARAAASGGILIGLGGLCLSFYNYRWQQSIYRESLEERVLVQLSAARTISSRTLRETTLNPEGTLGVEVVNIGMRPMYLKRVAAQFENRTAVFDEHEPLNVNESMRRLEPGEAASYKINWKFAEQAVPLSELEKEEGIVEVETSKKRFSQRAQVSRISITDLPFPLEERKFHRR